MKHFCRTLLGALVLLGGMTARAQGLEGIIVEEYYTITAADETFINAGAISTPITAGTKVYRVYVDMAPNYKLNTISGSPAPSPNVLDFTTTTAFWNDDNFGTELPPQTSRLDERAAFDSYITIGTAGRSGGVVGCGSNTQQVGVLRTADTNGNLTLCTVYSGWPTSGAGGNADGNIPGTVPALTYNLGGLIDFTALQTGGSQLVVVGDSWATLPNQTGVDPTGTNRVLIAQLTTDGVLSFHINVQLQAPGGALETYVWNTANPTANPPEQFSALLTYPVACTPPQITSATSNSPICAGQTLNLNATATGTAPLTYAWTGTGTISNGATANATVTGAATGNYNVTVSNACGSVNQNVAVTVNTPPNAGTNGTLTVCSNSAPVSLFAQLGGSPNAGGTWSGPSTVTGGNYDAATMNPGVYTYTVTGTAPCTNATATVTVTENAAPNAGTNGTLTVCSNSAAVSLFAQLGGTPNAGGTWSGPSTVTGGNYDAATMSPGVYTYTVTGTAPCANATATVTVTENAAPNAGTNGTLTVCSNSAAVSLFAQLGGSPNAGGTWSGPSTVTGGNYDAATMSPGVYTYTVTGTAPCANASATVTVTENAAPNAGTNGTLTVCSNSAAVSLFAQLGGSPNAGGTWSGPSTVTGGNYNAATMNPGVYTYTVAGTAPCANAAATVTVTENTAVLYYADQDGDGFGDPATSQASCSPVPGFVTNNTDNCPTLFGLQGDQCNDGNAGTINDVITANCVCAGVQPNDCLGVPGGTAQPGTGCNDNNPATGNDTWTANCQCVGQTIDCAGVPGGSALPGTACNDNDACTVNDVYSANCTCAGIFTDSDADGVCDANDNCPNTPGQIGSLCNDGNAATINDVITANCVCAGTQPNDCLGVPGGPAQPGTACNDNDVCTVNDVYSANCVCAGTIADADADGVCDANDNCPNTPGQVGSACNDGNPNTGNDVVGANCVCAGTQPNDCLGVPGGPAQPGTACNDNDVCTVNDVYSANCVCAGTIADADADGVCDANDNCPNTPGQVGSACDDGNPNTSNDVLNANCVCAGTQPNDCLGVPGGSAQPGTACNDNNPATGNDAWTVNCQCVGQLIDCLGVPGGNAVPGAGCNDNNVCTTNDVWTVQCVCAGTFQDTDGDGVCNASDNCPSVSGQVGSACDDGNSNTTNDQLNANCQCIGTPVGGCTENLVLSVKLDGSPTENTWQLWDATETSLLQSGAFLQSQANSTVNVPICVPVGCYVLRVLDSGNNGISGGGYVLRNALNRRIIDASLGSFTSESRIGGSIRAFCVPIGGINMLGVTCDATRFRNSPVYCNTQPGATGYQFWIYDPHGTYNRRVTTTSPNLVPANLGTNPVPLNVDLNIRARASLNNVFGEFGPACRIRFISNQGLNGFRTVEDGADVVEEFLLPSLTIYPNPNREGQLTVNLDGLVVEDGTTVDIDVYDMLGKRVRAERATTADGRMLRTMDIGGDVPAGIYMVNVVVNGDVFTQRLIKQ